MMFYDVANWFLHEIDGVSNIKLQKLVYYAYSWHLVLNNESVDDLSTRLFDNRFEAWIHGAVYPELYFKYKEYGSSSIVRYDGGLANFSEDDTDVLKQVVDVYGKYNGNQLESIYHQEDPWIKARNGASAYEASNIPITDVLTFHASKNIIVGINFLLIFV